MPKFIKSYIKDLEPCPEGKEKFIWETGDGAIKGFGIRIKPGGNASYLIQYRNPEGRTRRLVLGKVNNAHRGLIAARYRWASRSRLFH